MAFSRFIADFTVQEMWNGVLQLFIQLFINTILHLYNYLYKIGSADDFLKNEPNVKCISESKT